MIFADRKYDFVYAMRLSPCAGCGGKFIERDLYTVMGWHESLTFFEGDRLCRALGSRVPLFTLLPRSGLLGNWTFDLQAKGRPPVCGGALIKQA
jgi:hypothetical protein